MRAEQFVYNPSLADIVTDLSKLSTPLSDSETRSILRNVAWCRDELLRFEQFDEHSYRRNRIFRSEFVDLVLFCWKSGQRTPLHDHSGSRCGVYVLKGEGKEIGFERSGIDLLIPSRISTLTAGEISVSFDSDIHQIGNFSKSRQDFVTVHCYSPPLSKAKTYKQSETFMADYDAVSERAMKSGYSSTNAFVI